MPTPSAARAGSEPGEPTHRIVAPLPRTANLSDRVVAELEALIVGSHLAPGELLPSERELAVQFGVSRTVIREALRGLAARGLVDVTNGRGTVVRAFTAESAAESMKLLMRMQPGGMDLQKVTEVRRIIEDQIAALSAERRTEADVHVMEETLAEAAQQLGDPETFVRSDIGFHMALAAATHNELFPMILDSLSLVLTEVRLLALRIPGTPERALAHHRRIMDAVRDGDVAAARAAMDAHMDEARDTLQEAAASGSTE